MNVGVITGDIIQFTKLSAKVRKWLIESLREAFTHLGEFYDFESEIIRGDSFQCLVNNREDSLELALILRSYIRSLNPSHDYDIYRRENVEFAKRLVLPSSQFDVRIAVGLGQVDYLGESLSESDGSAFHLSGRALDKIHKKRQNFDIASSDTYSGELKTMAVFLDAILSKATALQCEVINLKLLRNTELEIAEILGVRQSAVNQRSSAGGWNAIAAGVNRFRKIYGNN